MLPANDPAPACLSCGNGLQLRVGFCPFCGAGVPVPAVILPAEDVEAVSKALELRLSDDAETAALPPIPKPKRGRKPVVLPPVSVERRDPPVQEPALRFEETLPPPAPQRSGGFGLRRFLGVLALGAIVVAVIANAVRERPETRPPAAAQGSASREPANPSPQRSAAPRESAPPARSAGTGDFRVPESSAPSPAPVRVVETRIAHLDLAPAWRPVMIAADPARPRVTLSADGPFRLRVSGRLYHVDGTAPLALDLKGLRQVEARAAGSRPVRLSVTRSPEARP